MYTDSDTNLFGLVERRERDPSLSFPFQKERVPFLKERRAFAFTKGKEKLFLCRRERYIAVFLRERDPRPRHYDLSRAAHSIVCEARRASYYSVWGTARLILYSV